MDCLGKFPNVLSHLQTGRKSSIVALHKFVFESEGDRNNRKRLREFSGFDFNEDGDEYDRKMEYVATHLVQADLTAICIILGLDYQEEDVRLYIFKNLRKNELLKHIQEGNDEGNGESDVENDDDDCANTDDDASNGARLARRSLDSQYENTHSTVNSEEQRERHPTPHRDNMQRPHTSRFSLTFKDVEDSIRTFGGTGDVAIELWIDEFEDMATLLQWDELQKIVFAKRSLKGLAKMFIIGEKSLKTWVKLKNALKDEFGDKMDSAQLHKLLTDRKMQKEESALEYVYVMKKIATRGDIEEKALIQYIIDGIRDLNVNKSILYGAQTLRDFKTKINDYQVFSAKQKAQNEGRPIERKAYTQNQKDANKRILKCYNCGLKGHTSAECKNRDQGVKCFNCNTFGHYAKDYPKKAPTGKNAQTERNPNMRQILYKQERMMMKVSINNIHFNALFDTGSKYNIIKESLNQKLNLVIKPSTIQLYGFGSKQTRKGVNALGRTSCKISVGGNPHETNFVIVADKFMNVDCIIGEEFCTDKSVTINDSGICFNKLSSTRTEDDNNNEVDIINKIQDHQRQPEIMQIEYESETKIDIDPCASPEAKQRVTKLIENYVPTKVKDTNIQMKIILKDESPIYSRPFRLPISERRIVDEQVEKWLKEGIIEPSESEYTSPVVLVKKRDGTSRMCVDYRKINKVVVKDRYPLSLIEDHLDNLKGAVVFSTIDLQNGFFHVPVCTDSRQYTSFVTHHGQYQFMRVPFGLCNSPSVFQRHINAVFKELTKDGIAFPYIDDVIIPGNNEEEAIKNLERVIDVARDYGLILNIKKCQFLKREVEFLGHVIRDNTISPASRKIDALVRYTVPKNAKEMQRFLGLANYFRKFVHKFSIIAKPLSDLLKQDAKFDFTPRHMQSFEALKKVLCQKPVLVIYNPDFETELHTDASIDGFGAILMQRSNEDCEFHPTYYMSKKTTDQERKYTSYELEVLAIVEGLKKFRVYLLGIRFKIITDCNAFTRTLDKRDLSTRVARWVLLLQEFDYTIEHRAGTRMRHVDALSRQPVMTINEDNILTKIKRAQSHDEGLKPIIQILQRDEHYDKFYLKSNVLYTNQDGFEKLVIPRNMQHEIIKNAHDKGHFGPKKTRELICNDYFIDRLDEKINKLIQNCITCILVNRKRGKLEGELNPLPKPDTPLQTYHMDFIGPLETTSKSYKHLLVVVDSFTKFCWLYPTKSTSATCVINKLMLQSINFGNPAYIITDRGSAFTSDEFKTYCESEGIRHIKVTTGLPRANGQVERMNAVIASVLAKSSVNNPTKWYQNVEMVQRYINASYSRSTTFTPFELMVGVKMKLKEDLHLKTIIEEEIKECYNDDRAEMRKEAKAQILRMQEENRRSFNKKRKPAKPYKEGDLVAIKRTQLGGGLKLKAKYVGPYEITKVKRNNTYDVVKKGWSDGPNKTSTCAEYLKLWPGNSDTFEANV